MTRARVAWAVAVIDIVAFVAAMSVTPSADPPLAAIGANLLYAVGIGCFVGVGALLITRVPANRVGPLLLAAGTAMVVAVVMGAYAEIGMTQSPPWPAAALTRTVGDAIFIYPIVIALIGIPLYFPDGRVPSPRFRWIVWIVIADMVVWTIEAVRDVRHSGTAGSNPGPDIVAPILDALETFVLISTLVAFGAAVLAVVLRFRRGDAVQREQIKWLLAVVACGAIAWPASLVLAETDIGNALSIVGILTLFALPVVIGIAILRYRLYEIDRIISRTIGWALVTGVLLVMFAAMVLAVQAVLATYTQGQTVAVAASTMVVFALFQPMRRRIQRAVDRRFDRARFDAERTSIEFGERLRHEVDIDAVTNDLARTTGATVAPAVLSIWLRSPGAGR